VDGQIETAWLAVPIVFGATVSLSDGQTVAERRGLPEESAQRRTRRHRGGIGAIAAPMLPPHTIWLTFDGLLLAVIILPNRSLVIGWQRVFLPVTGKGLRSQGPDS